ncbi:HIT family protein [Subtercola vilae]|uniref:HIT family protein n=1 Tax=Subtercola vilae TaxID=2056433 RepID=A0A4T2BF79_9MICO|nr:HIT family protein [Subtercola vilae]
MDPPPPIIGIVHLVEAQLPTCPFCQIVRKEVPAEIIYETDDTLAFFPLEPATRGHTMIIPKRHIRSFLDAEPRDIEPLGLTTLRVGVALQNVLRPEGMNLISSAGEAASQTVEHLHIHLVPRWVDDAVGEIWPPKHPTADAVLEGVADALREFCGTERLENRNPEKH